MLKHASALPAPIWLLLPALAYGDCPGYSVCPAGNYPKILETKFLRTLTDGYKP